LRMRALISLCLVGLVAGGGGGGEEYRMMKNWMKMKAVESCWGEENAKVWTVKMKKAVAECSETDAPELDLPPFRQPYRFINTLMKYADQMEERQAMLVYNVLKRMYNPSSNHDSWFNSHHQHNQDYDNSAPQLYRRKNNRQSSLEDMVRKIVMKTTMNKENMFSAEDSSAMDYNSRSSFRAGNRDQYQGRNEYKGHNSYSAPDSNNKYDSAEDMYDALAQELREKEMRANMMKYKVEFQHQNSSPFNKRDFSEKMAALINRRHRRAASVGTLSNPLDVGDRLIQRVEHIQQSTENRIGNMTCVLKKMGILNQENELDLALQRKSTEAYSMPDPWFKARVMNDLRVCNMVAESLPREAEEETFSSNGQVNMSKIKVFMKCHMEAEVKTCMAKDMKEKLEASFGKLESVSESTGLSEDVILSSMIEILYKENNFEF